MKRHMTQGVTLIEMAVTLAVLAISLSVVLPSMQAFVHNAQVRTVTNDLSAALVYARSEAVKRGWPVSVCKSADVAATAPSCATGSGGTWAGGWLVFVDHDGQGDLDTTASGSLPADELLRVGAADPRVIVTPSASFADYLSYLPNGSARGAASAATGSFTVCLNQRGRTLGIGGTGRLAISDGGCT